jgi:hypothetical protein
MLGGNREASKKYFREMLKVCSHADRPGRAEIAEMEGRILVN